MNDSCNLPHIYYTISELSLVNDVTVMKNLNIKTLCYIYGNQAYELDLRSSTFQRGNAFVRLDLTHIDDTFSEIKPYIIFGMLFSLNQCPVVSVKTLRQFNEDFESLVIYHNQSLAIRSRSPHFEDLVSLFKQSESQAKRIEEEDEEAESTLLRNVNTIPSQLQHEVTFIE